MRAEMRSNSVLSAYHQKSIDVIGALPKSKTKTSADLSLSALLATLLQRAAA
jgi:hypothetical protein